ncbi:hypothetical protein DFH09DRAFT_1147506 [Mycena vulgaris]|nr:hypothetical protein DFH09DRAFT_1147506 [Mycena vulgaris]
MHPVRWLWRTRTRRNLRSRCRRPRPKSGILRLWSPPLKPPPSASSVPPACRPCSTRDIRPLVRTSVPATPDPPPAPCLHPHADNHSPPLQHNTSPRPRCCVLLVDCRAGGQSATTIRARQRAPREREMHPNEGREQGAAGEQWCRGRRRRAAGG